MFTERYRSHHDAERRLEEILRNGAAAEHPGGSRQGAKAAGHPGGMPPGRMPEDQWPALEEKLRGKPRDGKSGVYIHVPHCDKICTFCNLNRKERQGADLDAYTDYLVSEIKQWGTWPYVQGKQFGTVYFGGGTPTVLNARQFQSILSALKDHIPLAQNCEITVESTQHNLGAEKAALLEAAGVNRFSIGIQTFSGRGREILGRTWPEEKAKEELRTLRKAFGGVLGIDIIYSYPDQTLDELRQDAEMCVSSGIDSVSFYSLMIQKGSALAGSIERQELSFERDIAFDRERHNLFYETLKGAGFTLLELSKLARPGQDRYEYIRVQYGNGDLIPVGSGAGGRLGGHSIYSMAPGRRFVSPPAPAYEKYHYLLGLLQFGLYDPELIAAGTGEPGKAAVTAVMQSFAGEGLLEPAGNNTFTLSADGIFWGNNIAVQVLQTVFDAGNPGAERRDAS